MSKTPFMPLWVADFLAKTSTLEAKEVGAYMLLLMSMWSHDGTLPADQKKLQRVARCGRDWPKIWDAIGHYFNEADGVITNRRLSEELQKVAAKREVNAQHGALGGKAKALKSSNAGLANAKVSLQRNPSIPEPEPYKEDLGKPKSLAFSEFWPIWPNKTAKASAEKAWRNLSQPDRAAAIDNAVTWFNGWRIRNPHASPIHPATYLNQKRWTDETQTSLTLIPGARHEQPTRSASTLAAFIGGAAGAS